MADIWGETDDLHGLPEQHGEGRQHGVPAAGRQCPPEGGHGLVLAHRHILRLPGPAYEAPRLSSGVRGQVDRQQVDQVAPPHVLPPLSRGEGKVLFYKHSKIIINYRDLRLDGYEL